MKKYKIVVIISLFFASALFLGGCEEKIINEITEEQLASMDLHPWLSGINQTYFGQLGLKTTSSKNYQMVIEELDFILSNSGMDQDDYERFVSYNSGDDVDFGGWFDLPLNEAFYPIGKDTYRSRESIRNKMQQKDISPNARHALGDAITDSGIKRVRVHSDVPNDWRIAIEQAAQEWNNLGSGIQFDVYYVEQGAWKKSWQIDISYDRKGPDRKVMSSDIYAKALFPSSNGRIGEQIIINSEYQAIEGGAGYPGYITASAKKVIMAHELGHTIGLAHTDGSDGAFTQAVPISGCGDGTTDPTSLMGESTYDGSPWQGFSNCDQQVIHYYW